VPASMDWSLSLRSRLPLAHDREGALMSNNRDLESEFESIYNEWFDRVGGDAGDFFKLRLSDDWVYIDYNGVVRYKPDYEPLIAPIPQGAAPSAPTDLRVRTFGEIAIVDGSYLIPGETNASPKRRLRFTAVWIDRNGEWQALAHHTSEAQRA